MAASDVLGSVLKGVAAGARTYARGNYARQMESEEERKRKQREREAKERKLQDEIAFYKHEAGRGNAEAEYILEQIEGVNESADGPWLPSQQHIRKWSEDFQREQEENEQLAQEMERVEQEGSLYGSPAGNYGLDLPGFGGQDVTQLARIAGVQPAHFGTPSGAIAAGQNIVDFAEFAPRFSSGEALPMDKVLGMPGLVQQLQSLVSEKRRGAALAGAEQSGVEAGITAATRAQTIADMTPAVNEEEEAEREGKLAGIKAAAKKKTESEIVGEEPGIVSFEEIKDKEGERYKSMTKATIFEALNKYYEANTSIDERSDLQLPKLTSESDVKRVLDDPASPLRGRTDSGFLGLGKSTEIKADPVFKAFSDELSRVGSVGWWNDIQELYDMDIGSLAEAQKKAGDEGTPGRELFDLRLAIVGEMKKYEADASNR